MVQRIYDSIRKNLTAYILISPAVIAVATILYYPMIRGIWMTFLSYGRGEWVGVANYVSVFNDPEFLYSLVITLVFLVSTIALQLIIGLGIALILDKLKHLRDFTTALALAPYMVPPVAGGVIWVWVLDPSMGLINHVLQSMGLGRVYFLSKGIWPVISIILAQTWKDFGYASIIYLANLETIPGQLYEAAEIDGSGPFQKFRYITIPHLATATLIILAIRTTWNIVEFALVFELTSGGPGSQTNILSILLYDYGFTRYNLGKAYVVGLVMIAIALLAFVLYTRVFGGAGGVVEEQ